MKSNVLLHSETTVQHIINAYGKELSMETTVKIIGQSIHHTIHQVTVPTRFSDIPP